LVRDLEETETRSYCAGEGQQQFNKPTDKKAKRIHKRQAYPLVREESTQKEKTGRAPQEVWCLDELIGGKPPVVN
jgi:hypothetical protein